MFFFTLLCVIFRLIIFWYFFYVIEHDLLQYTVLATNCIFYIYKLSFINKSLLFKLYKQEKLQHFLDGNTSVAKAFINNYEFDFEENY